jgi:transposase
MQDANVDLWATDEVHFQQHGSRCRMWIPPEIKDPVLLHAPTRKSVGYFGAVRLRDGRFVFRLETGKFNGPSFLQFLQQLRSASRGTGRRVVVITDNARYHHSRLHRPWREQHAHHFALDFLPAYSPQLNPIERVWKLTRRRCCTIATSTISKTSSARLNPSSQPGPLATMSSADYAQLLKTPRLRAKS